MSQEIYKLEVDRGSKVYTFDSEGPKGVITKRIHFSPLPPEYTQEFGFTNVYNLGFGDYDPLTGILDDKANSNNGDRDKVLVTVAVAAIDFLRENPDITLYVTGSTKVRTRLYQIGVSQFYDTITSDYDVWGLEEDKGWEVFERNTNYQAFVMRKR